ncbi:MAG TPA: GPW/gp25 family protein [Thermoanaerobaculia bacterium]|nr:GPW/gp25 family protein [Thermoanaerobaculia bacterium]
MNGRPGRPIDPAKAFLGVGWAFPLRLAADREIETAVYEEDVREAILIILGTRRNERVMRPDFGAGLEDFVFETINTTTIETLKRRVHEALIDWEPRIDVESVDVKAEPPLGRLLVGLGYRIRATNTHYNLVFPFYLQEGASA